jgi:hypothetical protein
MAAALALRPGGRDVVRTVRAVRPPRGAFAWLLVLVCGALLAAEAPTWFAPPVGGDQTKYHLAYPRLWAMAGGLVDTPWCFWGSQQWLQNFLFVLAYAVRGENLARLLNATAGVLAAVSLATLARRHFDRRLGIVVGALFFTMPMTWSQMTRSGADMSVVAYAALAVSAWLDWAYGQRPADLRRTAIYSGLAGGSKVMGLLVPALVGIGILVVLVRRRPPLVRAVGNALAFGAIASRSRVGTSERSRPRSDDPPATPSTARTGVPRPPRTRHVLRPVSRPRSRQRVAPYRGVEVAWFPDHEHPSRSRRASARPDGAPLRAFPAASWCIARRAAPPSRRSTRTRSPPGVGASALCARTLAPPRRRSARRRCRMAPPVVDVLATVLGNVALTTRLSARCGRSGVAAGKGRAEHVLGRYPSVGPAPANVKVPESGRSVLEKIPHPYYIDRPFVLLFTERARRLRDRHARRGAPPHASWRDARRRRRGRPRCGGRSVRAHGIARATSSRGSVRGAERRRLCALHRACGRRPAERAGPRVSSRTRSAFSAVRSR